MKNLIPFAGDFFTFHTEIIESKKIRAEDPDYKARLKSYNPVIKPQFILFLEKFNSNTLVQLKAIGFKGGQLSDLQSLYKYKSKILQKLKILLTTDENNRISNTCQYCTVGEVNSFDHYLPQSVFAEFIVHPLNLTPSCTNCNSQKSLNWQKDEKREYLNLYLDILPQSQYLFISIEIINKDIKTTYFLENRYSIDPEIFELIRKHYTNLDLFTRFKDNSDKIISELAIQIDAYSTILSLQSIKDTVIEECNVLKIRFGSNYWPIILKLELVNNETFLNNTSFFR